MDTLPWDCHSVANDTSARGRSYTAHSRYILQVLDSKRECESERAYESGSGRQVGEIFAAGGAVGVVGGAEFIPPLARCHSHSHSLTLTRTIATDNRSCPYPTCPLALLRLEPIAPIVSLYLGELQGSIVTAWRLDPPSVPAPLAVVAWWCSCRRARVLHGGEQPHRGRYRTRQAHRSNNQLIVTVIIVGTAV